jgi:acyl carrier protein
LSPADDEFISTVAGRHHSRLIDRDHRAACAFQLAAAHSYRKSPVEAVMLIESSDRMTEGELGGRFMTTVSTDGTWLSREIRSRVCNGDNIRAVIADQLGVDIKRVSDEAHLARDLGVGWLNRLELVIFVEDWTGLELHDDDVEKINVVGDLIRLFESAKEQRDRLN